MERQVLCVPIWREDEWIAGIEHSIFNLLHDRPVHAPPPVEPSIRTSTSFAAVQSILTAFSNQQPPQQCPNHPKVLHPLHARGVTSFRKRCLARPLLRTQRRRVQTQGLRCLHHYNLQSSPCYPYHLYHPFHHLYHLLLCRNTSHLFV